MITMLNTNLDDIFGYKLYRSFSLIKGNIFHEFHQNHININFEQWIILNRLWDEDKQSQNSLLSKKINLFLKARRLRNKGKHSIRRVVSLMSLTYLNNLSFLLIS